MQGQFKDCGVPLPAGASCPTGTVITLTVDPRTNTSTDFDIESHMPDVKKIGVPEPLPLTRPSVVRTAARIPASAYEAPAGTPDGDAERIAGARYFAGIVDDPDHQTVHLNLVHAPQSIIHRIQAAYPDTFTIDNDAPRSWAFVTHLQRAHALFALKSKGIDMVEDYPTQDGTFVIGVSSNVADAQAYFDKRYGRPDPIRIVRAEPGTLIADAVKR